MVRPPVQPADRLGAKANAVERLLPPRRAVGAAPPGALVDRLTGREPDAASSWIKGAIGEERLGRVLDALADGGKISVLHDRRLPDSATNIDHLVVAPTGVWVIDAKRYSGRVEVVNRGGLFGSDLRLKVNRRDRTDHLVGGVHKQVRHVASRPGRRQRRVDQRPSRRRRAGRQVASRPVPGEPMLALAGIAGGGVAAQWLAWRLRVPVIIVLLVGGLLAGPVTGLLDPDDLFGDLLFPVVSLSVGIILFEGSLRLGVRQLRAAGRVTVSLITVGAAVSFVLTAALALVVLGRPAYGAALLGAILVVTGPTVIGPLLSHMRPRGRVGPLLQTEGILIDPLGAVLALIVFEVVHAEQTNEAVASILATLASVGVSGIALGLAGAALVWALLRWFLVPDHLQQATVLATVVVVFAAADHVQEESGLLAVTVMGLALANQRRVSVERVAEFSETLQVLLVSGLFLLIAARLDLDELRSDLGLNLLFLAGLVLLVRPTAVWLSTLRSGLSGRERTLLAVVAPRGIVAAAVSSVFALRLDSAGLPGGDELATTVVVVIICTIALAGIVARPMAQALGLAQPEPDGVLIIGAHGWGRQLAAAFEAHGVRTKLVERDRAKATTARLAGSDVHFGSILADHTVATLDTDGIGHLLAITGSDEVNALAAERLRPVFGSGRVWRLAPSQNGSAHTRFPHHLPGRVLFAHWATEEAIEMRVEAGAGVKGTRLSGSFGWDTYRHRNPDALVLALVRDGRPVIAGAADRLRPRPGDVVISLVFPVAS